MRFSTSDRKHFVHYFTVTGRGVFPADMLRYDNAWPLSSEEAAKIVGQDFGYAFGPGPTTPREKRDIRMGCIQPGGPTIGRWSSFGWSVGDVERGEVD